MSQTPTPTTPQGDDRNLVTVDENYLTPGLEDRLRMFWEKNRNAIFAVVAAVIVVIVARGAWDFIQSQREAGIAADYDAARADEAKLKNFAGANSAHVLGGLAHLQLADTAYKAGRFAEARSSYTAATTGLGASPFVGRARVGAAISAVLAGATAEGETQLKAVAGDATLAKVLRAEACYHLAALAVQSGRADEARKWIDQIGAIGQQSPWERRAFELSARLATATPEPATGATDAAPTVNFTPAPATP